VLLRTLLSLLLFFCLSFADEYPITFSKLSIPLYKATQTLQHFKDTKQLKSEIEKFTKLSNTALVYAQNIDNSRDKQKRKNYLKKLRKLQKNYDYILHLIHVEIEKSIDNNEYENFCRLTEYKLDGLLQNTNLKNRSIEFYTKNSHKQKNSYLETEIGNKKLLKETTQEFYNQIVDASYDSTQQDKGYKRSVSISAKRVHNSIDIFFTNSNLYAVTVNIAAKYKNITPKSKTSSTIVIQAKSSIKYTTLKIGNGETTYSYRYRWIIGDENAVHNDNYRYSFPYKSGTRYRVSQGFNGTQTHKGNSQYAIDFAMDEGTKVYSVREGTVIKTKSNSNLGGFEKKFAKHGNYVTIAHDDGTFATYYHLKRRGVLVNIGQKVSKGYPLGYSGNTGYSSGPHLHLAVFKAISAVATHTIAIKFLGADGVVNEPLKGSSYTAK